MPNTSRVSDSLTHGAVVVSGSSKVIDQGQRTARIGDRVICPLHGPQVLVTGNPKVVDEGQPTSSIGDRASCGAVLVSGAGNVVDGGGA